MLYNISVTLNSRVFICDGIRDASYRMCFVRQSNFEFESGSFARRKENNSLQINLYVKFLPLKDVNIAKLKSSSMHALSTHRY